MQVAKEAINKALSNLSAQRAAALARNDTKTAALIQRVINLLEKKK
jgi:phage gp37-like protein